MTLIPAHIEFVELLMACKTAVAGEKSDSEELIEFARLVESGGNWSVKVFVKACYDLAESFVLFAELPEQPGSTVPLEETMRCLKENFNSNIYRVLQGLLLSSGKFSKRDTRDLLSENPRVVMDTIKENLDLSGEALWILSQLTDFPDQAREILIHSLEELKGFYEKTGLGISNRRKFKEATGSLSREEHVRLSKKILEYYDIVPDEDVTIHILFQNIDRNPVAKLYKTLDLQYIVVGNESSLTEAVMYPLVSEGLVRGLLKNLADPTKLRILISISDEPRYVDELAGLLGLSKATISYHLSALSSMDIVVSEKRERRIYFSLNQKRLDLLLTGLGDLFNSAAEEA